jgi:hypothetical protein
MNVTARSCAVRLTLFDDASQPNVPLPAGWAGDVSEAAMLAST